MLLALAIYLIDILHSIDNAMVVFIAGTLYGIYNALLCVTKEDELKAQSQENGGNWEATLNTFMRTRLQKWATAVAVSICIVWLAPDKETSYTMLAAYGLTEAYDFISESEEVQGIASKSLKLIEKHIDKYIEGMDNENPQGNTQPKQET